MSGKTRERPKSANYDVRPRISDEAKASSSPARGRIEILLAMILHSGIYMLIY